MLDMPEENDVNSVIDAVRSAKGSVLSVVPRKKRLEDLFVETVSSKPTRTVTVEDTPGGSK